MTSFATPSTRCCASTDEISRVDGGYFFSTSALRDTVAGWSADHEAVEVLHQGMSGLKGEIDLQNENLRTQLTELQTELSTERKEYKRQIKRGKVNGFLLGTLIGSAIGAIAASR